MTILTDLYGDDIKGSEELEPIVNKIKDTGEYEKNYAMELLNAKGMLDSLFAMHDNMLSSSSSSPSTSTFSQTHATDVLP